jgi:hypothetical protein
MPWSASGSWAGSRRDRGQSDRPPPLATPRCVDHDAVRMCRSDALSLRGSASAIHVIPIRSGSRALATRYGCSYETASQPRGMLIDRFLVECGGLCCWCGWFWAGVCYGGLLVVTAGRPGEAVVSLLSGCAGVRGAGRWPARGCCTRGRRGSGVKGRPKAGRVSDAQHP